MAEKTFDEKFLENSDRDIYSFKDDFECLFETIKAFNEFVKTESFDMGAVKNLSEIYKEIDDSVREVEKYFFNWTEKTIDEVKDKEDESSYKKICRGLNQLNADIRFGESEFWDGHNEKKELFCTTVDVLEDPNVKFVVSRSKMQDSIQKLERCKNWLEIRNPDLTDPTPKDDPSPTPDEIEPQDAPNEATSELYAGLEWKADLADLAELIKGLRYKQAIHKNGRPITIEGLQLIFEKLFNVKVKKIHDTFRERMNNKIDPSFLQKLSELNKKMHEQNKNSNKYR